MNPSSIDSNTSTVYCEQCRGIRRCHRVLATMFIEEMIEEDRKDLQQYFIDNYMSDPYFVCDDDTDITMNKTDDDNEMFRISQQNYNKRKKCTKKYIIWKIEYLHKYNWKVPTCFLQRIREIYPDPYGNYDKDNQYMNKGLYINMTSAEPSVHFDIK